MSSPPPSQAAIPPLPPPRPRQRTVTRRERFGSRVGQAEEAPGDGAGERWCTLRERRDATVSESGLEGVRTRRRTPFSTARALTACNSLEAKTGYHSDRVQEGGAALVFGSSATRARLETWSRQVHDFRRKEKPVPGFGDCGRGVCDKGSVKFGKFGIE